LNNTNKDSSNIYYVVVKIERFIYKNTNIVIKMAIQKKLVYDQIPFLNEVQDIKIEIKEIRKKIQKKYNFNIKGKQIIPTKIEDIINFYEKNMKKIFTPKYRDELRKEWQNFLIIYEPILRISESMLIDRFMVHTGSNKPYDFERYLEIQGICPNEEKGRIVKIVRKLDEQRYMAQNSLVEKISNDKDFREKHLPKCQTKKCKNNGNYLYMVASINHAIAKDKFDKYENGKYLIKEDKKSNNLITCVSSRMKSGGRFTIKLVDYLMGNRRDITDILATRIVGTNKERIKIVRNNLSKDFGINTKNQNRFYKIIDKEVEIGNSKNGNISTVPLYFEKMMIPLYGIRNENQLITPHNYNVMENNTTFNHPRYVQLKTKKRDDDWSIFENILSNYIMDIVSIDGFKQKH